MFPVIVTKATSTFDPLRALVSTKGTPSHQLRKDRETMNTTYLPSSAARTSPSAMDTTRSSSGRSLLFPTLQSISQSNKLIKWVTYYECFKVFAPELLRSVEPFLYVFKGLALTDIVHQQRSLCATIVAGSNCWKPFLSWFSFRKVWGAWVVTYPQCPRSRAYKSLDPLESFLNWNLYQSLKCSCPSKHFQQI